MLDTLRRRKHDDSTSDKASTSATRDNRGRALVLSLIGLPLLLAVFALVLWWSEPHTSGTPVRLDQFTDLLNAGRIKDATFLESDNRLIGTYDGGRYWVAIGNRETLFSRVTAQLSEAHVPTTVRQQPLKAIVAPVLVLLPTLILVDGFFILYLMFGREGDGFMAFGRSGVRRATEGESIITFASVAGVDEAVEELSEVRDYLAKPERFTALGAAVPKGILLTGPPGCGKTLLARALAGEANVPFFSIAGSNFAELFIGVGAARIRDFFKEAKASAPCIAFIDELDAVGRSRAVHGLGGSDEREATLNQLLVEMDGFDSGTGVLILAATNRPDILDEALLRPGRFDRRVSVDRPDVRGREGILGVHVKGKPIDSTVDLAAVARQTVGFSGADLANVINEAALLAARRGATTIGQTQIGEAIERAVVGPERRSRVLSPEDRRRTAAHEAGHVLVSATLATTDPIVKVSIVARGHAGGFTWWAPEGDQLAVTRPQLVERITTIMAGRAAEALVTGQASSAALVDLDMAMTIARRMVTELGMSERLGPFSVGPLIARSAVEGGGNPYSERVASEIDTEIQTLLSDAEHRATEILGANRAVLDSLVDGLIERESLEGDALRRLLSPAVRAAPAPAGQPSALSSTRP